MSEPPRRVWSALASAAYDGDPEGVELALQQGGCARERDQQDFTPLHWCAFRGAVSPEQPRVTELLLDAGADPNAIVAEFESVLNLAVQAGELRLLRLLLGRGADPNLAANEVTPLMVAAREGEFAIVELLLEAGARPALRVGSFDAIDYAERRGQRAIAARLREAAGLAPQRWDAAALEAARAPRARSFERDDDLLCGGSVVLYHRCAPLRRDAQALERLGYECVELQGPWSSEGEFHEAVAAALPLGPFYGASFEAFEECLAELLFPPSDRLALLLLGYDHFARAQPGPAHEVLDVLARSARRQLLAGRRLLVLVQSDDSALQLRAVGATPVLWNDSERFGGGAEPEGE